MYFTIHLLITKFETLVTHVKEKSFGKEFGKPEATYMFNLIMLCSTDTCMGVPKVHLVLC